ncbi:DNA-binding protein [Gallibacterium sp. AGMB14963]|uniref:DNA-binding protein n=1 Tax=Gallibacterium faecale TaxID=3019086 RepID=UPI0022F153C0|nr:DNA-binding protein [Gallibacterium sp. AGMB14963]MDA3977680.1 DNA-binding protein [Gallibacterium sp. AGMB14963]
MEQALSLKKAAKLLDMSYDAVYNHRHKWGFFKMPGSRLWRIYYSDLEKIREKQNNVCRLEMQVGDKEKQCRSTKKKMVYGGLISGHRADKELDALLKRLKGN